MTTYADVERCVKDVPPRPSDMMDPEWAKYDCTRAEAWRTYAMFLEERQPVISGINLKVINVDEMQKAKALVARELK